MINLLRFVSGVISPKVPCPYDKGYVKISHNYYPPT